MTTLKQLLSQPEREREQAYRQQQTGFQQSAERRAEEESTRRASEFPLEQKSKQANLERTEALTKAIPLRMEAMKEMARMSPATQKYMEAILGLPPGSLEEAKKSEAFALSQTQRIPGDVSKSMANLDSGIRQIGNMRGILNSKEGQSAKIKAGGNFSQILSLGDKTAQNLRKATVEVTDIITRERTGAALNNQELNLYADQILSRWDTPEATETALKIYDDMFKEKKKLLSSGRPIPLISKDDLLQEISSRMEEKLGQPKGKTAVAQKRTAESIIRDGQSKGLSRDKIKAELKASGF